MIFLLLERGLVGIFSGGYPRVLRLFPLEMRPHLPINDTSEKIMDLWYSFVTYIFRVAERRSGINILNSGQGDNGHWAKI
jgi:hypothetical protein